jgi:general secretion pathway protein L
VTLAELLRTDHTTAGRWLRSGLVWWASELVGMLPGPARRWFETRPSLTAQPLEGGYRLTRNSRLVMESAGDARRPRPVTLRLPREAALIREAPAPAMPEHDLRRMLELDIDRLTPFRPDQVFVAVVVEGGNSSGAPRRAVVAAIQRDRAVAALEHARSSGLDPRALGVDANSPAEAALDFLPKMREADLAPRPSANRALIWGAVALLAVANLGAAIGRDTLTLNGLRKRIELQRAQVSQVQTLRRKVLSEEHRRADIISRRAAGEPLRMLNALTGAVPNGAWIDRLAFDGQSVRVSGYRQDQVDVAAALRAAPLLVNVRNSGSDVLTRQAAGQPFDLTVDLRKPAGG